MKAPQVPITVAILSLNTKVEKDRNGDFFAVAGVTYLDGNNVKHQMIRSNTFASQEEALQFVAEQHDLILMSLGIEL